MRPLSLRLARLKKRLHEVDSFEPKTAWFQDVDLLQLPEYAHIRKEPIPVRKGHSYQYIADHLPVLIKDGELIVGCPNLLSFDIGMYVPKYLTEEERDYFEHHGLSEQSMGGHHPAGYDAVLKYGTTGLKERVRQAQAATKAATDEQLAEWRGMILSLDALERYADRYAAELRHRAETETNELRRRDYAQMADVCCRVPRHPAKHLQEAAQSYWFLYTLLSSAGELIPLGRLDQYLYPYYQSDVASGCLTKEEARDILGSFLVKFNERVVYDTHAVHTHWDIGGSASSWGILDDDAIARVRKSYAELYWHDDEPADSPHNKFFGQEVNNACMTAVVGGLTREGKDATNPVSYELLQLMDEMNLLFPTFGARIHEHTPRDFIETAAEILTHGQGEPIIYNDRAILHGYGKLQIPMEDAREYSSDGCWETVIPGKTNFVYYVVFVLQCLEYTMNCGRSVKTGGRQSIDTGELASFQTFDAFYDAFRQQMEYQMEARWEGFMQGLGTTALVAPDPLFSALSDSCVATGRDYYGDGAQYQSRMILMAGFANAVNALTVIRQLVYEEKRLTLTELNDVLHANWQGHERLHALVCNRVAKYGNDDAAADDIGQRIIEDYAAKLRELRAKSKYFQLMGGIGTFHVYAAWGDQTSASADGRYNYDALAPNYSPVPGTDKKGPLAALQSSFKADLTEFMGGTPVDITINANEFEGEAGIERLRNIIEVFCEQDGQNLTVSANSVDDLRDAKAHPEKHRNLRVRMGGLSAYFVTLAPVQQDEIIARYCR